MGGEKHDQEYMKKVNKQMVLQIIKSKGPISRADIARITSMSPTSISRIVGELTELDLVQETEFYSEGVGRKGMLVNVCPESVTSIGIYINRDIVQLGLVDFCGKVVVMNTIPIEPDHHSIDEMLEKIVTGILVLKENPNYKKIIGIGVGMPGIINLEEGKVIFSAQLGWKNIELKRLIGEKTGMKVIIDNTEKLRVLAENLYGASRHSNKSALLSVGSGVGSAVVIDDEVLRGVKNSAGEIGHTTVDPEGMLCECGRRGCLQTYIAESALLKEANKVCRINSIDEIFGAAENNENWATNLLERAAKYIAIAINNIACMYNPDTIILSGRLIEHHPLIVNLIEQKMSYIWEPYEDTFKLVYSELKDEGVLIGAATLALNTYFELN